MINDFKERNKSFHFHFHVQHQLYSPSLLYSVFTSSSFWLSLSLSLPLHLSDSLIYSLFIFLTLPFTLFTSSSFWLSLSLSLPLHFSDSPFHSLYLFIFLTFLFTLHFSTEVNYTKLKLNYDEAYNYNIKNEITSPQDKKGEQYRTE